MSKRSGVLYNLGLLSFGQVVSQLLNVWALVYLAGLLGAHWFGVVQVGVAVMAYALITAEWGLKTLGIREVSRLSSPAQVFEYARSHSGLLGLQTLVVLVLAGLVLPRLPFYGDDPVVFQFYVLAVIPQIFTFAWVATGLERLSWVTGARITLSLCYALGVLVGLKPLIQLTGQPAHRLVPLLFVVGSCLSAGLLAIPMQRWFGGFPWLRLPDRMECRRRWRLTGPIGGSIIVLRVLLNVDLIALGLLATPTIVGHYAAASRLVFLLVVAVEVLWGALLPRMSRLAAQAPADYGLAFNRYFGFVVAGLLPVMLGGWLLGPQLLALIYGGQYDESGSIFQILCLSYGLLAVGTFLGNSLVAADQQDKYLPPVMVAAGVAVLGNAILIPRLGANGAAWAMLAAHSVFFLWLARLNSHRFNRTIGQTLLLLIPAIGCLGAIVFWTAPWPILVRITVAGAVYTTAAAGPLRRLLSLTKPDSAQ